ncbi:MAG: type III polyketide synthase [Chlamydiales bacterium]|nr:type III polyketide synthase [Chlamydiales bacterium]
MNVHIADFVLVRPRFKFTQEVGIEWLLKAHAFAEQKARPQNVSGSFQEKLKRVVEKVACKKQHISMRGYSVEDITHEDWQQMPFFGEKAAPHGVGFKERSTFFEEESFSVFERLYKGQEAPVDLIHVTCTGYAAPSAAQKLVARNGWSTRVAHAYHMGCCASVPALRMGKGFVLSGSRHVDIVHTEICSLHFNPAIHTVEQILAHSLFADGFIKYSLRPEPRGFELLATDEAILSNTESEMSWKCEDWGLRMTLSKEIPRSIENAIFSFVEKLTSNWKGALFAIHPGGPKIIDAIQKKLGLSDEQVAHSKAVLHAYGNMSSATLPHIWELMLPEIEIGQKVVSLAFGPGLTIVGAVLQKVSS